jgi:glycosyltransferase involved in cell wall biosynthesis
MACFYSNYIWNLSPLMQQGREENGLSQERCAPQLTVPVGCDVNSSDILPIEEINPYTIAYIGGLTKEVGVYFLIESMSDIINVFPKAKLIMIGSGAIEPLKKLSRKFNVEDHIVFLGVIKQDKDAKEIISKCTVGIAFYLDWSGNFKKYCEPSKIKFYLSCGLPVITNNMTYFANIIQDRKAGLVVEAEKLAFVNAIGNIFGNKQLLEEMKRNVAILAKEYTWDKIFANAFKDSGI